MDTAIKGEIKNIDSSLAEMGGMLPAVLRDLERYRDNHRFLLILSCSFAELLIGTLIEEHCTEGKQINANTRDFSFSARLTLLHEMKILPDIQFQRLNWLRKHRNDAAHKPDFAFTSGSMPSWGGEDHRTPQQLFSLCVNILGVLWNQYVELFREKLPIEEPMK